jgi:hypothetical protein
MSDVLKITAVVQEVKYIPAQNGRPEQNSVRLKADNAYGCFVPVDHPLSNTNPGDLVQVEGSLRLSGRYLNLDNPVLLRTAEVVWGK